MSHHLSLGGRRELRHEYFWGNFNKHVRRGQQGRSRASAASQVPEDVLRAEIHPLNASVCLSGYVKVMVLGCGLDNDGTSLQNKGSFTQEMKTVESQSILT